MRSVIYLFRASVACLLVCLSAVAYFVIRFFICALCVFVCAVLDFGMCFLARLCVL